MEQKLQKCKEMVESGDLDSLQVMLLELLNDQIQLENELKQKQSELHELKDQNEDLHQEQQTYVEYIQDINTKLEEDQQLLQQIEQDIQSQRIKEQELIQEVQSQFQRQEQYKVRYQEFVSVYNSCNTIHEQNQKLAQELQDLQNEHQYYNSTCSMLESQTEQQQKRIQCLQQLIQNAEDTIEKLDQYKGEIKENIQLSPKQQQIDQELVRTYSFQQNNDEEFVLDSPPLANRYKQSPFKNRQVEPPQDKKPRKRLLLYIGLFLISSVIYIRTKRFFK
ncbi:hypothetical protein pb186bvf_010580 [Paramecium bursaria]